MKKTSGFIYQNVSYWNKICSKWSSKLKTYKNAGMVGNFTKICANICNFGGYGIVTFLSNMSTEVSMVINNRA